MMPDFGVGLNVVSDWPLTFVYASGLQNLGNNLARRLQTIRGSLAWDLNCGYNLRDLFRGSWTTAQQMAAQSAIGAEMEKDPRVQSATATLTYVPEARTLVVAVAGVTANGPFSLVIAANSLTLQILRVTTT
jgi:hypothetical protein